MLLVVLFVVSGLAILFQVKATCMPGSVMNNANGICYWGSTYKLDAVSCNVSCGSTGEMLAEIPDAASQLFIETNFASFPGLTSTAGFWIGVHDIDVEDSFTTWNGQPQVYFNWRPGQPNDASEIDGQDCIALFGGSENFLWQDKDCTKIYMCLCSYHEATEPTTIASTEPVTTTPTEPSTTTSTKLVTTTPTEPASTKLVTTTPTEPSTTASMKLVATTPTEPSTTVSTTTSELTITPSTTAEITSLIHTSQTTESASTETATTTEMSPTTSTTAEITTSLDTPTALQMELTTAGTNSPTTANSETSQNLICSCSNNSTIGTNPLSQEEVDQMIRDLSIEKNSTSTARRKLTCAEDNRPSAQAIGYIGIIILCVVYGVPILVDLNRFCK